jgi:hypothetical protein
MTLRQCNSSKLSEVLPHLLTGNGTEDLQMRICAVLGSGLLLISMAIGCASTPAAPQINVKGEVTGIKLPADCGPVQFKITMTQDQPTPRGTGAYAEGLGVAQNGTLQMPDLTNFDFAREVKIDVVVARGNCAPFVPPATWHFEGILQSLGSGTYSGDFSKFQKK